MLIFSTVRLWIVTMRNLTNVVVKGMQGDTRENLIERGRYYFITAPLFEAVLDYLLSTNGTLRT